MKSSKSTTTARKTTTKPPQAKSTAGKQAATPSRRKPENVTIIGSETPLSSKPRRDVSLGDRKERKSLAPGKTTVITNLDVGYGNALFIRGSGAGLTWKQGQALGCLSANQWAWQADNDLESIEFKLLINDEIWSSGENMTAAPGEEITCNPEF